MSITDSVFRENLSTVLEHCWDGLSRCRLFAASSLLTASFILAPLQVSADAHGMHPNSVVGTKHMISTANPYATEAGLAVLEAGGTAMDAAIAAQFMLNLVEPESSGIGGGAFLLYWDAEQQKLLTYDGREKAPASATEEYFFDESGEPMKWSAARPGGLSVGVPGTLKLLETAHQAHGTTSWYRLLAPSIKLADEGFPINKKMANAIVGAAESGLMLFESTKQYFFNDDGTPKTEGTTLTNPDFAHTLRLISALGSDVFYNGPIAKSIVDAVKTQINPGQLTLDDLASYEVIEREPVCFPYREFEVCGMGPPTSGGLTMGQMLGMLAEFDLPAMGPGAESWHLYIEAAKLAYADRGMYMADSDFVDMPEGLLDADYLKERASLIMPDATMAKAEAGNPPWDEAVLYSPDLQPDVPGTSHLAVADQFGNRLSMTTTIESGFGSRVMTRGFLLNNELTDFSFRPEKDGKPIANRIQANKRPRSSMSPTIVLQDGAPILLTGSPGGSRIINYVTQSVIAILDWKMDPQDALAMPHVVNRNGKTDIEEGTDAEALIPELEALGHEINTRSLFSGLHAIFIQNNHYYGAADPRRAGVAMGE